MSSWENLWLILTSDPVFIIPASYIIDLKGKPLDVITITEELNEDIFAQRLKIAMKASSFYSQKFQKQLFYLSICHEFNFIFVLIHFH